MNATEFDIVVVGAGVAGSVFAAVMARAGKSVLLLERTERHVDVVRGEWLAPWGVAETRRLGLYELYLANGGHHLTRHVTYHEDLPAAVAQQTALDLTSLLPDNAGPLCIRHPHLCTLLNNHAVAQGATLHRGVRRTHVTPGERPLVTFEHGTGPVELRPKLVVGADGRNGFTARQIGATVQEDPTHHYFSGMLVENVPDWPDHEQCIATEGDVNVLVFPQGNAVVRLYIGFALARKGWLMGPHGPQQFLDAFRVNCVPGAQHIAAGTPAGPCFVYPNHDTWIDRPYAPGVVLIGDAAGRNDPITGQGLSISHRDVRVVTELVLADSDWSVAALAPYGTERAERMRRLRYAARAAAIRDVEFTDEARTRRVRVRQRLERQPELLPIVITPFLGPEHFPAEAFSDTALAALLA